MEPVLTSAFNMLKDLQFKPFGHDDKPLSSEEQQKWLLELRGWEIRTKESGGISVPYLWKRFQFTDFKSALAFVNRVGELAESVDHHPDISLSWGKVDVTWWTHSLGGLHLNDFILAAKTETVFSEIV